MGEMKEYGDFESYVLQDTAAYYSQKASAWIEEDTCPDYMLKAEECLKREKERVAHYLHASSEQKLLEQVQLKLLSQFEQQLLEKEHSGCRALLRDDKVDDLSRMCRLFSRILQGLQRVANIFRMHVTDEGMMLVKQAEDAASGEKEFVAEVIQLHDKYMHYVNECFSNQPLFHKALKEAFVVFCNKGVSGSTSAELLATFCDNCLKKGGSGKLGDDALDETLEKVVKILAYISDKDLFAEVYRKKLAQRLLFVRSVNDGHERSFLTKLKQQCDGQFTVKMEGMVRDVTLAKELQNSFQGHLSAHPDIHPGIELTATVLMTGNWPSYQSSHLALPSAMVKCVETFRDFYKTKNKNRKLNWIYSLGTCNVLGKFEQKSLELIVTTYQAAVLLLFNSTDGLNYSEIKAHLNLSDQDMVRVLHSLSCAKYKILSKEPNTAIVGTSDLFEFNSMFTDKMSRIKIPFPPMDEKKKIVEDVDKNRRYAIDASIVCIMKSRKALKHQALILECVEQLAKKFKPDLKIIKNCIEGLITREFLARDEKDPHTYKYLA